MSTPPKNISRIQIIGEDASFGRVTYQPGGTCGPRLQQDLQLVVLHEGSVRLTLDERHFSLVGGEGILLPLDCRNYFEFDRQHPTFHSWCQLPREQLPLPLMPPEAAFSRPFPCSAWLLHWMREGWWQAVGARAPSPALVASSAWMAISDFCQQETLAATVDRLPKALRRAREWMEANLSRPMTLHELATRAGASPGYLTQLANEHWHSPPMAFLWNRRVEEGARLLRDTGQSVSEIAYYLGFSNPFHFSRRFKRRYGTDPRSFRKASWTGERMPLRPSLKG